MVIVAALMAAFAAVLVAGLLMLLLWRPLTNSLVDMATKKLLTERYSTNLWELTAGFGHHPILPTMENEMRAAQGQVIKRPMGTARRFMDLSGVMFNPAQLQRAPLQTEDPVDMQVTLGPKAERPLVLEMPLLVGAMGYGIGVSDLVAHALAQGAAQAGTAYNAGEGPLLPEVRRAAHSLIVQYTAHPWSADPHVLRAADMVEIRLGQGAWAALGSTIVSELLSQRFRQMTGLPASGPLTLASGIEESLDPDRFRRLVQRLRETAGGVPVGVKLAASFDLEADLDAVLHAGVDVIALDGAQGGTHTAPPILADDFGLPTLHALVRAVRHLERAGARDRVSLIIGGGLRTPADYLKCLALGADAVYIGSTCLWAATHTQMVHALPFEPPTQLTDDTGALKEKYDVQAGARSLANFLKASAEEMAMGARALGRASLREVSRGDLYALDQETAALTGLPAAVQQEGRQAGQQAPAGPAATPAGVARTRRRIHRLLRRLNTS